MASFGEFSISAAPRAMIGLVVALALACGGDVGTTASGNAHAADRGVGPAVSNMSGSNVGTSAAMDSAGSATANPTLVPDGAQGTTPSDPGLAGKSADPDGDGIPGSGGRADNCPQQANPLQEDKDGDGVGDACDNCVDDANADQRDFDADGTGDRCACDNQYVRCENGMAGGRFPCDKVDMYAYFTNDRLGARGNDVWGWYDKDSKREYAIACVGNGTVFIDISNPHCPAIAGRLPTASGETVGRDAMVYADHAFLVAETRNHGMQVFDLKELGASTQLNRTFKAVANYTGTTEHRVSNTHTIALNTDAGFAYLAGTNDCRGGLHIVDVRTPQAPKYAGCWSELGYVHEAECLRYRGPDAAFQGRDLCIAAVPDSGVVVVDVTDPAAPKRISVTSYMGMSYPHQGWLTDDQRYLVFGDELDEADLKYNTRTFLFDMSSLAAPKYLGAYSSGNKATDHNQYIRGNYSYQANYTSGMRIIDISGIAQAQLKEVAYFDTMPDDDTAEMDGSWAAYPYLPSGTIVVNGLNGLFLLRATGELSAAGLTP